MMMMDDDDDDDDGEIPLLHTAMYFDMTYYI